MVGDGGLPRRPVHDRGRRRRDAHRGPAPAAAGRAAARTRRSSAAPATGRSPPRRPRVWIDGGTIADVGIALSAVGLTTIHLTRAEELLRGKAPSEELFAQAGEIASEDCSPGADGRGPVDYKRHLAGVLTQRALRRAIRARPPPGGLTINVSMTVNGEQVTHDIEPRLLLVHFLRETLDLTGTHWGCDTSNCGACVVLMDGEPVKSCTIAGGDVRRPRDPHRRVARGRRRARPDPAGLPRAARAPVRLLHARDADDDAARCSTRTRTRPTRRSAPRSRAPSAAAPATRTSSAPCAGPPSTKPRPRQEV